MVWVPGGSVIDSSGVGLVFVSILVMQELNSIHSGSKAVLISVTRGRVEWEFSFCCLREETRELKDCMTRKIAVPSEFDVDF